MRIAVGNNDGSFTGAFSVNVGTTAASVRSIAAGDFNLDGFLDLAVTNVVDRNVSVLLADGNGNFMPKVDFPLGGNAVPSYISVADVNKDGLPDIITNDDLAAGTGNALVRLNQCQ